MLNIFGDLEKIMSRVDAQSAGVAAASRDGALLAVAGAILGGIAHRRDVTVEDARAAVFLAREAARALSASRQGAGIERAQLDLFAAASDLPLQPVQAAGGEPSAACPLCAADGLKECREGCVIRTVAEGLKAKVG